MPQLRQINVRTDGAPIVNLDSFPAPPAWTEDALCAQVGIGDDAMWFPGKGDSVADAKAVCALCDVRLKCLDYALANEEDHGVWGGTSREERRRMRRTARNGAVA